MHIEMIRRPDAEGDDNRGFQVDLLEMRVDGLRAGHLTMSHVPFHRLLSWHGLDAGRKAVEWTARMAGITSRALLASGARLDVAPVISDAAIGRHWERMGRSCRVYGGPDLSWHVDRPMVDYIRVYTQGEPIPSFPGLRFVSARPRATETAQADFLNRRLGILLYAEGARWLGERNLVLHASGLQTPEAIRAWNSMERRLGAAVRTMRTRISPADAEGWRRVLEGRLLPETWLPRPGDTLDRRTLPAGRPVHSNNILDLEPPMRTRFMDYDADAILAGRNPLGGEPMPATPEDAIKAYGRQQEARASRLAALAREAAMPGCACGGDPCMAAAPGLR